MCLPILLYAFPADRAIPAHRAHNVTSVCTEISVRSCGRTPDERVLTARQPAECIGDSEGVAGARHCHIQNCLRNPCTKPDSALCFHQALHIRHCTALPRNPDPTGCCNGSVNRARTRSKAARLSFQGMDAFSNSNELDRYRCEALNCTQAAGPYNLAVEMGIRRTVDRGLSEHEGSGKNRSNERKVWAILPDPIGRLR